MKKILLLILAVCFLFAGAWKTSAETLSFPMEYTNGSSLLQPQTDYTYYGNNYTFDNLLVLRNAGTGWYSVYYFNLTSWWPKAVCASAECSGTGQINTRIDRWLYAYDFGSNPIIFDYPAIIFNAYRSFYLSEIIYATFPIYDSNSVDIIREADTSPTQLTIVLNPTEGGGVSDYPAGENIYCGIDGYDICQASFEPDTEVTLDACPNDDWAFAYWDNGIACLLNNPLTLSMNGNEDLTLTAKFFKTFRCAAGDFYADIDDTGGWCTDYVNYETDSDFSGNAYQWWQEAIDAGYNTGSAPAISAIIVFNQDSLEYGHVGIVIDYDATTVTIRDSNWCDPYCFLVKEHPMSRNRSDISGYIYCTP